MDVKSVFLYGKIEEEVYVCQPPGFEDPDFLDRVYKVEKALYGLHQAPRAWYETLSTYLLDNEFQRGKIDKTLFIKRYKGKILLVQVYVDDIIFGSTKKELCNAFEKLMHEKFQMSSMGELTFFLGLQNLGLTEVKTTSTPMETQKPLLKDEDGKEVDVHMYRSMIGSLMYLTSSRPDIMFALSYIDSDYVGASLDGKSTTGGYQFLESRLISWQCKKQTVVANSTTEADNEAVHKERGDSLVRAATTASSLEAEQDSGNITKTQSKATPNEVGSQGTTSCGSHSGEDSLKLNELMASCTNLQQRVLDLETTKTTQANEIMKVWVKEDAPNMEDSDMMLLKTVETRSVVKEITTVIEKAKLASVAEETVNDVATTVSTASTFPDSAATTTATTTAIITDVEITLAQALRQRRKHFAAKRAEEKRNKPPKRAQQRSIMCTYLKNMKGWKPKNLKNKSFANIQELFDKAMKRVNTFVDYRTELVEESSKKAKAKIAQESSLKRA
ncbi:uncharacterized mitochondrial protein-like protein [Tanacetum coccineum]